MKKYIKIFAVTILVFAEASCVMPKKPAIDPTANFDSLNEPKFDFKNFFDGKLEGSGIIYFADGKMQGVEQLSIQSKWRDKNGVLEKTYQNNPNQTNSTWLVESKDGDVFTVVGHGFNGSFDGKQKGNAAVIAYSTTKKDQEGNKIENKVIENYVLSGDKSIFIFVENHQGGKLLSKEIIFLNKASDQSSSNK